MAEGFFEFHEKISRAKAKARSGKGGTKDAPGGLVDPGVAPLTVSALTNLVEKAIATGLPGPVAVRGEVSNARGRQASGHLYFTLKDSSATLNCVMWRDAASRLKFEVKDGIEFIATGRVTVYAPQGKYQLQATSLEPVGKGALELAFRQLQEKLAKEGLFDAERKKPIAKYPRRIVMVTSQSTAALQDMLKVLRRYPWLKLMLYHVPVQGEGAGEKIAAAVNLLNRNAGTIGGVDVILLGRGGGSLEDLWAFNEEVVARAIADSRIPVVSGIGHEIDCTIADLVADYHAHTPTEAAQVVVQYWKRAADELGLGQTRLNGAVRQLVRDARQRVVTAARHEIFRRPMDRVQQLRQLMDDRQRALSMGMTAGMGRAERRMRDLRDRIEKHHPGNRINLERQKLASSGKNLAAGILGALKMRGVRISGLEKQLNALSPQAVLGRGYSITSLKKSGKIVRRADQLRVGDRLTTRFADGEAESVVEDSRQLPLFE